MFGRAGSTQSACRQSPHEPGLWFVNDQEWNVGARYTLLGILGHGSYTSVCRALDHATGEEVALKRIPDVLSSPDQARRVIREVCILRRLHHPFIIQLLDAFVRPASSGPRKLVSGRLVPMSLDVYIAMELGSDGDLFHLRGQLTEEEVRLILWQMLMALKFLHSINVWHRDIKSSNVLLARAKGHRIVKVADFGSARSAKSEGYHWAEQGAPEVLRSSTYIVPASSQVSRLEGTSPRQLRAVDSYDHDNANLHPDDLCVKLASGPKERGFRSPLTKMVATPCYRAPEVVMSRGGYTSAIDIWSLGCIFGELLQRVKHVGSATTPHLQVAPLFAMHAGALESPSPGDRFAGGPGNSTTRKELATLFAVIGTPSWADVDAVQSPLWQEYLQKLPGKAPTLHRRLGFAGEASVHLLERMLAFDPGRRCSAEEALTHEYFADLQLPAPDEPEAAAQELDQIHTDLANGMSMMELESSKRGRAVAAAAFHLRFKADVAEESLAKKLKVAEPQAESRVDSKAATDGDVETCEAGTARGGSAGPSTHGPPPTRRSSKHFYNEADPARALGMLEEEMQGSTLGGAGGVVLPTCCEDLIARLRCLLEEECEAQSKSSDALIQSIKLRQQKKKPEAASPERVLHMWVKRPEGVGLKEDLHARFQDPAECGRERLTYVADHWKGKLDPADHLNPGRHGEWTPVGGSGPRSGPTWGVTSLPPGLSADDPGMAAVIRSQQAR